MTRAHTTPRATSTTATSWSGDRASFPTSAKRIIRARDKVCRGCGSDQNLEFDHIVNHARARRLGWAQEQIDHPDNGQLLCATCHGAKSLAERQRPRPQRTPQRHPGLLD